MPRRCLWRCGGVLLAVVVVVGGVVWRWGCGFVGLVPFGRRVLWSCGWGLVGCVVGLSCGWWLAGRWCLVRCRGALRGIFNPSSSSMFLTDGIVDIGQFHFGRVPEQCESC